ncbi:MAG: hypothetical protein QW607_09745 [Desulfurococcaceae archaeon]
MENKTENMRKSHAQYLLQYFAIFFCHTMEIAVVIIIGAMWYFLILPLFLVGLDHINEIIKGKEKISSETVFLLGIWFPFSILWTLFFVYNVISFLVRLLAWIGIVKIHHENEENMTRPNQGEVRNRK